MRRTLAGISNEQNPFPADARSRGYIDSTLIEALIKELPFETRTAAISDDAQAWEAWCSRCVFVQVVVIKKSAMPVTESFLAEWNIDADSWASQRGRDLREHASLFEIFSKRADAYGLRLLALPLAEESHPDRVWSRLWDMTVTLREIIEFGDEDVALHEGWRGRSEASGLMRLVFGLGLMIMDQIISPVRETHCDRHSTLQSLLQSLTHCVHEVRAIDRFDQGYWDAGIRHLAIRRGTWLAGTYPTVSLVALDEGTKPTLEDFVSDLSGDSENLFALIETALRNGVSRESLKMAVSAVGVDLRGSLSLLEKLVELAPQRIGIGTEQLRAAQSLLD
jgi:hypothetical protein